MFPTKSILEFGFWDFVFVFVFVFSETSGISERVVQVQWEEVETAVSQLIGVFVSDFAFLLLLHQSFMYSPAGSDCWWVGGELIREGGTHPGERPSPPHLSVTGLWPVHTSQLWTSKYKSKYNTQEISICLRTGRPFLYLSLSGFMHRVNRKIKTPSKPQLDKTSWFKKPPISSNQPSPGKCSFE